MFLPPAAPESFYTIIHHHSPSPLFTIIHHYSPLLTIVHLFTIIHHYSQMHHYSPLFTMIHHSSPILHYSPLFTIIHQVTIGRSTEDLRGGSRRQYAISWDVDKTIKGDLFITTMGPARKCLVDFSSYVDFLGPPGRLAEVVCDKLSSRRLAKVV